MLTDPLNIAASAPTPAVAFAIIRADGLGTDRRDATGIYYLIIRHGRNKDSDTHYLQVWEEKDAISPYSGTTSKQKCAASISVRVPKFGWTEAQASAVIKLLTDTLAVVTPAKLLQFQS